MKFYFILCETNALLFISISIDSSIRSDTPKCLDSSKHLDHSFERLIRNSRPKSPFHRELKSCYRESCPSVGDSAFRHKSRDHIPLRDTFYSSKSRDSLHFPPLSLRSKSYHGDLSRITQPTSTTSSYLGSLHSDDTYRSSRLLSHSASNLNGSRSCSNLRNFTPAYVNTYSRHHSHHSHQVPDTMKTPVQMNWRSRFRGRTAYKAYRSRSVNQAYDRDYSMPRSLTPGVSRADSAIPNYPSLDSRVSKSFSDIRTVHPRIDPDPLHLTSQRENSYSSRNINRHSDHEPTNHILNPDIYVRWLKNKWDLEESMRRNAVSMRPRTGDYMHSQKNRFSASSYPSRMKSLSYDSLRHSSQIPTFSKTIKGRKRVLTR